MIERIILGQNKERIDQNLLYNDAQNLVMRPLLGTPPIVQTAIFHYGYTTAEAALSRRHLSRALCAGLQHGLAHQHEVALTIGRQPQIWLTHDRAVQRNINYILNSSNEVMVDEDGAILQHHIAHAMEPFMQAAGTKDLELAMSQTNTLGQMLRGVRSSSPQLASEFFNRMSQALKDATLELLQTGFCDRLGDTVSRYNQHLFSPSVKGYIKTMGSLLAPTFPPTGHTTTRPEYEPHYAFLQGVLREIDGAVISLKADLVKPSPPVN